MPIRHTSRKAQTNRPRAATFKPGEGLYLHCDETETAFISSIESSFHGNNAVVDNRLLQCGKRSWKDGDLYCGVEIFKGEHRHLVTLFREFPGGGGDDSAHFHVRSVFHIAEVDNCVLGSASKCRLDAKQWVIRDI